MVKRAKAEAIKRKPRLLICGVCGFRAPETEWRVQLNKKGAIVKAECQNCNGVEYKKVKRGSCAS